MRLRINIKNKWTVSIISFLIILSGLFFLGHYGLRETALPLPVINPADIIKGTEPIFLANNEDKAVLLIHGFRSTPQSLKYLGEKIHNSGYTVIIPLLPGHGTNYDDFERSRYYHWYAEMEKKAIEYRNKFKYFHIVGLSMGGSITLDLLQTMSEEHLPDSAALISTPVFLNKISFDLLHIQDWRLFFTGIIQIFTRRIPDNLPSDKELSIIPEITYGGYHVPRCVHSLKLALHKIDKNLIKIKTPLLILQAIGDKSVSDKNLEYIYNSVSSSKKEKYMFNLRGDNTTNRHTITLHRDIKETVAEKILDFLRRHSL